MNLACAAYDYLGRFGDHEALIDGDSVWTAAQLLDQAGRMATGLAELGVAPGDRVVVVLPYGREVLVTGDAVWRCGAVAVFATTGMPAPELARLIELARPAAIVCEAGERIDVRATAGNTDFESLIARHRPLAAPVARDATDLALLMVSSGTSGLPKLVEITHGSIDANIRWRRAAISDEVARRELAMLQPLPPPSFGGQHMIARFLRRMRLVGMRKFDAAKALALIERHRIQRIAVVPMMAEMMLASPRRQATDVSSLREIMIGGDHVTHALWAAMRDAFGVLPTVAYGMSEIGGAIAGSVGERSEGSVGRPVPGVEVQIVDPDGRPVPAGDTGEIRARAPWAGRGYFGDPEQTARVFRDGWVLTGDVGRFGSDGELFLLGRTKQVVIRGGYNIAPQDVVEVLVRIPGVQDAAAFGVRSELLGEELVACIVPRAGVTLTADDVMARCRSELDSRKLPGRIEVRTSLPRNAGGKLDVNALRADLEAQGPAPGVARELADALGPAERTAVLESYLCGIIAARGIAAAAQLDRSTVFGRFGLDSLQLVSLRNQVEHDLDVAPDLDTLADGTVGSVAAALEGLLRSRAGGDPSSAIRIDLPPTSVSSCRATTGQRLFWRLGQAHHEYNVVDSAMLLEGQLDRDLLARALTEITRRHTALRTTFAEVDGEVIQRVLPADQVVDCTLELDDLSALSADEQVQRQRELILEYRRRPYDLRIDHALRPYLLRLAPDRHLLVIIAHHIAVDASAVALVRAELAAIYAALHDGRPVAGPARLQYIDYADQLRRWSTTDDGRQQRAFWARTLADAQPIEIPGVRDRAALELARAAAPDGIVGEPMFFPSSELPPTVQAAVARLSHDEGVSPRVVYLAAFVAFLHRAGGLDDVCLEEVYTPRLEQRALEPMIAMLVYPRILRVSTAGAPTLRELVHRAREAIRLAQKHTTALAIEFAPHPLRRVNFNYLPHKPPLPLELAPGLTATPLPQQPRTSFRRPWDFQMSVVDLPSRPISWWMFNERLFSQELARRLIDCGNDTFALISTPDERVE